MKSWFHKTHNQIVLLNAKNPIYRDWISACTTEQFIKDIGKGDITTDCLFSGKRKAVAKIVAQESGILAGRMETEFFLVKGRHFDFRPGLGKFNVKFFKKDGETISANDTVCKINGRIKDILKIERTVLNLLGRLSGIATMTKRITQKVYSVNKNILVTPTRKTLWGLLDKRACAIGGGGTHRLNLNDAILIKDNHLDIYKRNIETTIRRFFPLKCKPVFFEIEVGNKSEALNAGREFKKLKDEGNLSVPCFIMLDNFSLKEVKETMRLLEKNNLRKAAGLEISGGVTEKNVIKYAKTGVDIISMGQLTHSAKFLDFSLCFSDSH